MEAIGIIGDYTGFGGLASKLLKGGYLGIFRGLYRG